MPSEVNSNGMASSMMLKKRRGLWNGPRIKVLIASRGSLLTKSRNTSASAKPMSTAAAMRISSKCLMTN